MVAMFFVCLFFCQNSAPWMLLRNFGIKTIWMVSKVKPGQTLYQWFSVSQLSCSARFCRSRVVLKSLHTVPFFYQHHGNFTHFVKGVSHILLITSCHILIFWYCMKSLWYPVSPCLGQNHQVLCLMWTLFQNCHVALGMPSFSLLW